MKDRYIFLDGEEYYNFGKIIDVINDCILVQLLSLNDDIPRHSKLYHLECLAHSEGVIFFETYDELKEWLDWLQTPSSDTKPKIVKLRKDN